MKYPENILANPAKPVGPDLGFPKFLSSLHQEQALKHVCSLVSGRKSQEILSVCAADDAPDDSVS